MPRMLFLLQETPLLLILYIVSTSFLLLVVRPGAPSSVLVPCSVLVTTSKALVTRSDALVTNSEHCF